MKVLAIGDIYYAENVIGKMSGSNLTCRDNVIVCSDSEAAKDFLLNSVANKGIKQHIDLIVVDDAIEGNRYQMNFCEWLRSVDESFSDFNFRLSSIPVILYKRDVKHSDNENHFYNAVLPFSEDAKDLRVVHTSGQVIKRWRKDVLSDLEILGIDIQLLEKLGPKFLEFQPQYNRIAKEQDYYYTETNVVAREFIRSPQFLAHEWLSERRVIEIERSLEEYEAIIKNLVKYNGRAFERQILHQFYNRNQFFLTRDVFEKQIYDKRFYVSTTSHYHIPDYILQSSFPGYTATSISEIKRHNINFQFNPKRHQNFTNYSQNALNQASNYEDDFTAAGLFNKTHKVDLIIGLDDKLTEFIRGKIAKHYSSINVITHNGLIGLVENYYNRLNKLRV